MVDPVGNKPLSIGERGVGRVERLAPARVIEASVRAAPQTPASGLGQIARDLAGAPPVDTDRVNRIRRAIAEGRFPISPATIADRLLALRLNWDGNDKA